MLWRTVRACALCILKQLLLLLVTPSRTTPVLSPRVWPTGLPSPLRWGDRQDDAANPLVGVSGRTSLLQRLGEAVSRVPEYFTAPAIDTFSRPGSYRCGA